MSTKDLIKVNWDVTPTWWKTCTDGSRTKALSYILELGIFDTFATADGLRVEAELDTHLLAQYPGIVETFKDRVEQCLVKPD
jgi:hypothetical protein